MSKPPSVSMDGGSEVVVRQGLRRGWRRAVRARARVQMDGEGEASLDGGGEGVDVVRWGGDV